jgi:hypothetical protein
MFCTHVVIAAAKRLDRNTGDRQKQPVLEFRPIVMAVG